MIKRLFRVTAAVFLIAAFWHFGGCERGKRVLIAGKEPMRNVVKVENNSQALKTWIVNKARADVLVHIDALDDMRIFPEIYRESMNNAAAHIRRGNAGVVDRIAPIVEQGGTANLGFKGGLYKRVVWVLPSKVSVGLQPVDDFRRVLRTKRGYSNKTLEDLEIQGRYIEGTLAGVPITVTSLADLDVGDEDVILDIDLSYFVGMKSLDPDVRVGTRALLDFMRALGKKNLETRFATVTLSNVSGICPMDIRFFGDLIVESLADPKILVGMPPEKWRMMIEAEDSLVAGGYGAAEGLYERLVADHPKDPGLFFSLAVTRGFMEKGKECNEVLLQACRLEGVYIRGLFQLVMVLAAGGKVETGKEIIESPDLSKIISPIELNQKKGVFYLNAGRPYDAITYLMKVSQMRPNDFALRTVLYRAYRDTGDERGMISTLEKMRTIDEERVKRDMPWAYKELGGLYEGARLYKNALRAYEIYLEIAPGDTSASEIREKIDLWRGMYKGEATK